MSEGEDRVELQVFFCRESYIYQIPSATTVGHRADLWNVNKWLTEVSVRVVTHDEECYVRLEDCKSGELFAECPIPPSAPLVSVVEPVIDSSRYFVLRIVDRDTDRHAFIGLGFRERSEASNFNAALHEHQQYIKRKRVAEARRRDFEERQQRASEGSEGAEADTVPATDYSIKPGEKITIKLNVAKQDKAESFLSRGTKLAGRFSFFGPGGSSGGEGGAGSSSPTLAPPPALRRAQQPSPGGEEEGPVMCVSPRQHLEGGSPDGKGAALPAALPLRELSGADLGQQRQEAPPSEQLQQLSLGAGGCSDGQQQGASGVPSGAAAEVDEDDWGDFTS